MSKLEYTGGMVRTKTELHVELNDAFAKILGIANELQVTQTLLDDIRDTCGYLVDAVDDDLGLPE